MGTDIHIIEQVEYERYTKTRDLQRRLEELYTGPASLPECLPLILEHYEASSADLDWNGFECFKIQGTGHRAQIVIPTYDYDSFGYCFVGTRRANGFHASSQYNPQKACLMDPTKTYCIDAEGECLGTLRGDETALEDVIRKLRELHFLDPDEPIITYGALVMQSIPC